MKWLDTLRGSGFLWGPVLFPLYSTGTLQKLPLALCGCFRYRDGPAETATSRKSENEKMKDPEAIG